MAMLIRKASARRRRPMADINVTPMVDVMLVLLVVFMITAPMLATGVAVNLPKTRAEQLPTEKERPLVVTVDKDGKIYVGMGK
jgi:biopolymer transport protein TolR